MSQLKSVLERIYADLQDKIKPMTKTEFIKKYKTNPKEETVPGPKKPRTAYILYNTEKRQEVITKHPNLKNPEIVKMLAEMWRSLTPKQKEPFLKMAEEDKQRYAKELAAFSVSSSKEEVKAPPEPVTTGKKTKKTAVSSK